MSDFLKVYDLKRVVAFVLSIVLIFGSGVVAYNHKMKSKYILENAIAFDNKTQKLIDVSVVVKNTFDQVQVKKNELNSDDLNTQVAELNKQVQNYTDAVALYIVDAKSNAVASCKMSQYEDYEEKNMNQLETHKKTVEEIKNLVATKKAAEEAEKIAQQQAEQQKVKESQAVTNTPVQNQPAAQTPKQQTPTQVQPAPTQKQPAAQTPKQQTPTQVQPAPTPAPQPTPTPEQPAKTCTSEIEMKGGGTRIITYPC